MAHQRGFIYAMSLVTQEPIKIHQICIWQMEVSEKGAFMNHLMYSPNYDFSSLYCQYKLWSQESFQKII